MAASTIRSCQSPGTRTIDGNVLFPSEAEAFVQSLEATKVDDFGTARWATQHEFLEKLNMQAIFNAASQADDFVKNALCVMNKIDVLIEQLIAIELWKENIYPLVVGEGFEPKQSFPLYMVLHHEATVINLLETVMYHQDACECAKGSGIDLVDYCHRKIMKLVAKKEDHEEEPVTAHEALNTSTLDELSRQDDVLQFDIGIKCISVLRYLVDHRQSLPLGVLTRILNTHDIPCLMVQLIEEPPWTKKSEKGIEKYIDGQWKAVSPADTPQMTKLEAQLWLILYQLLMDGECQQKYNWNPHTKSVILKLRAHMAEPLLDQLPILVEFRRFLEHLAVSEPPAARSGFILEQVPEIRQKMIDKYSARWARIAKLQQNTCFSPSDKELQKLAQKWSEIYNLKTLESLLTEPPKCALCGSEAPKRCSRCQNEWYCSRECQVKHWPKHKNACNIVAAGKECK